MQRPANSLGMKKATHRSRATLPQPAFTYFCEVNLTSLVEEDAMHASLYRIFTSRAQPCADGHPPVRWSSKRGAEPVSHQLFFTASKLGGVWIRREVRDLVSAARRQLATEFNCPVDDISISFSVYSILDYGTIQE